MEEAVKYSRHLTSLVSWVRSAFANPSGRSETICGCLWIFGILLLVHITLGSISLATQDQVEDDAPIARQNALLRTHFREMLHPRTRTPPNELQIASNDEFVERFIDRQIDNYLKEIDKQLNRLNSNLTVAEEVRDRVLLLRNICSTEGLQKEAFVRFDRALKEVQDSADSLKDQLQFAFNGLGRKTELEHVVDKRGKEDFYQEELRFLRQQSKLAEEGIRDYLFRSVSTVEVRELREENMVVCLSLVEKMAREVRRSLS